MVASYIVKDIRLIPGSAADKVVDLEWTVDGYDANPVIDCINVEPKATDGDIEDAIIARKAFIEQRFKPSAVAELRAAEEQAKATADATQKAMDDLAAAEYAAMHPDSIKSALVGTTG